MKRVLKILIERDDMSRGDAIDLIENFEEELEEAIMSGDMKYTITYLYEGDEISSTGEVTRKS